MPLISWLRPIEWQCDLQAANNDAMLLREGNNSIVEKVKAM